MGVIGTITGVNVIEQHIREYERKLLMSLHQARFALSAELNWNRNHAPTPAHLLRLKKPILPERWDGYKNGWGLPPKFQWPDWMEQMMELRIMTDKMVDELLRMRPTPDAELFFDEERQVVGWRVPPEVEV